MADRAALAATRVGPCVDGKDAALRRPRSLGRSSDAQRARRYQFGNACLKYFLMTPERWQQVKVLLVAALERPENERATFVTTACEHDTSLRREVQSLLAQPEDEFDSAAQVIGVAHEATPWQKEMGRRIGAYELTRELGRGGMGAVWLARRADQQFEKLVAIKLLKRGTDTDEVLRRFHAERQILARLEHPNIARLLDGGMTDDGLPYFVMEFVEGKPLTDFCIAENLTVEQRLRLFLKICGAVQFAHQNLIVHRDLKPGNILVTEDCEPKLLDFGIAKLLADDETFGVTLAEHQRLTPGYASPEQVRGEPVTTVSDIYTLGTLLYEILTGQKAHRFSAPRPPATELLRVVAHEEAVRPSAAASDPVTKRRLRGDLDNIILKALRKEPARRYAGMGSFAGDIRRYLEKRPVTARKDSAVYRTSKLIQRNKLGAAATVLVLIILLAGIVATTRQTQVAKKERARAERRFNDLRKISNSLMFELHNAIRDLPGALAARQLVISRALEYLDSLAQEAGDDLSLKSEVATAYTKVGLVTFDVPHAINSHRKAASLNEELVAAAPRNISYRKQLSDSYDNLSDVMKIAGYSEASIDYARRALELTRSLAAANPADNELQAAMAVRFLSLGIALDDAGQYDVAIENERAALLIQQKIVTGRPHDSEELESLSAILGNLSDALEDAGDYNAALDYARQSAEIATQSFRRDSSNASARRGMWAALLRTGRRLLASGKTGEALPKITEAAGLIEGLAAADPNDIGHKRWLAVTYRTFADLLGTADRSTEALDYYHKAISIAEPLAASDPDRVEVRRDLARTYESLGLLYARLQQSDRALSALEQAKALAETSGRHDPNNARLRGRLAKISAELSAIHSPIAKP